MTPKSACVRPSGGNNPGNTLTTPRVAPLRFTSPAAGSHARPGAFAVDSDDHSVDDPLNDDPFLVVDPVPVPIPGPDPIYPLQPGQNILRTLPRLDANRSHGFYIIFKGLKIGIFYAYWYDYFLLSFNGTCLILPRSEIEPLLMRNRGGHFAKAANFKLAKEKWDAVLEKRVLRM